MHFPNQEVANLRGYNYFIKGHYDYLVAHEDIFLMSKSLFLTFEA